jgi:lysophospholipase L1-like esterase
LCTFYESLPNDQFEVLGYVKPGASSKSLMESVKSDIGKLTMDDFLIMCSGSNDAEISDFRKSFHDVISFVKSVKHTNVIVVSIPYRYDLMSSYINKEIKNFNRKLCKLAKIFSYVNAIEVDSNRQLFTTHGLHLNGLGKESLSSHILLYIYSALDKVWFFSGSCLAGWLFAS